MTILEWRDCIFEDQELVWSWSDSGVKDSLFDQKFLRKISFCVTGYGGRRKNYSLLQSPVMYSGRSVCESVRVAAYTRVLVRLVYYKN